MIEIIPNWHPIFVHFTVALITTSLALFVASFAMGEGGCRQQVQTVAKWNLWIGAGVSVLTLAAGVYAYYTVAHDTPSHEAMTKHRNLAFVTLAIIAVLTVWSAIRHRKRQAVNIPFIVVFLFGGALLASTAWHGGEVVYRYGLGVMSLPKTDSHNHGAHSHGDEAIMDDDHSEGEAGHEHAPEMNDSHHDDEMISDHHHDPQQGIEEEPADNVHVHDDGTSHIHEDNNKENMVGQEMADHHDDGHAHEH